jgi:hypothetical protein
MKKHVCTVFERTIFVCCFPRSTPCSSLTRWAGRWGRLAGHNHVAVGRATGQLIHRLIAILSSNMSLESGEHTGSRWPLEEHQVCLPGDFSSVYNMNIHFSTYYRSLWTIRTKWV